MKQLSKMSLDFLEVESFVSPTELELSQVKGGTSIPCVDVVVAVAGIAVAAYTAYTAAHPPSSTVTTTYPNDSTKNNTVITTYGGH